MAAGNVFTVTTALALQPAFVYTIVSTPAATPPTVPADTVAIPAFAVVHTPPAVASTSVVAAPTHTLINPVIAAGDAFIVIILVTVHPVPSE